MNHHQAKEIIRNTFQNAFDRDQYIGFIRNLLNKIDETKKFKLHGQYIEEAFRDFVFKYERIGTYTDPDGKKIDLLMVFLRKESTLDRARTTQRNFIARYLKNREGKDAGLIAFVSPNYDEWRFSFVKMDYKLTETQKGGIKAVEDFTPAKRYSFLVGSHESSHTAQRSLLPILEDDENNPRLEDIEKAFNVEKVTKEFFEKYRELFFELKKTLDDLVSSDPAIAKDFNDKSIDTADFSKKLLGQIVFLYFLQKKGWFGVKKGEIWGGGSKQFLRELFEKKHGQYDNFFNDVLEPLFYEALSVGHRDDYYSRFKCRIPFLNGGLFDPLNDYDWQDTDIFLPNDLFSNQIKTPEGDIGNGILDIFDRYNFTVNEDEPLEREVAVDPEMLGKVFENLLAIKDRKSKGTYYTPREIVHYMCQESLSNYLTTELQGKVTKEEIDILICYGETVVEQESRVEKVGKETTTYFKILPESIRKYAKAIDEKLSTIRVCDPAVGSGAFPVGMMNEIVRTRTALNPFLQEGDRSVYSFKRDAIQNCLYGVDIDPGAVEIAKLRLWLSLIVDEEDIQNIRSLPNLDYKIVTGNSLLRVERTTLNWLDFEELENLKLVFFDETDPDKKKDHKKQIDDRISRITNGHKDFDFNVYFSEVFHEKKGFDVIIANPPYIRIQELQKSHPALAKKLKTAYYSASGSYDIYVCFVELATKQISPRGNIAFILPHKFFQGAFGANIREIISKKKLLRQVVDFGHSQVFETATTYTCLLFLSCNNETFKFVELRPEATQNDLSEVFNAIANTSYHSDKVDIAVIPATSVIKEEWLFTASKSGDVINKLKKQPRTLADIAKKIFVGLQTSADKIYFLEHISENKKTVRAFSKALDKEIEIEKAFVKPLLKGADVHRWRRLLPRIWCVFPYEIKDGNIRLLSKEEIQSNYPLAWKYLSENEEELKRRENFRFEKTWWQYSRPQNLTEFEKTKIITPEISLGGNMTLDTEGLYHNTKCYSFVFKKGIAEDTKYFLALLNSKLLWFFLTKTGYVLRGGYFVFKTNYLMPFPLPQELSAKDQKPFISLVDSILAITSSDDYSENIAKHKDVQALERRIDQMVYELYSLSEDEITIVEESI